MNMLFELRIEDDEKLGYKLVRKEQGSFIVDVLETSGKYDEIMLLYKQAVNNINKAIFKIYKQDNTISNAVTMFEAELKDHYIYQMLKEIQ